MDIKNYSAILIGLLLVLTPSVFAAVTVTRDLPTSAAPGSTITVTLAMTVSGTPPAAVGVTEYFPTGWIVSNPTFNAINQGDRLEWLFWSGGTPVATRSITYKLTIPASASGTATFSGTVDTGTATDIAGDTTMSVSGGATTTSTTTTTTIPYPAYATRDLPSSAKAGTAFTVSLALSVDETDLPNAVGISEIVPSGWNVSSVSTNGNYFASEHKIEWLFWNQSNKVEDRTVTYTITSPTGATGSGTFAGTVDYGGATNPAIGGDTMVTLSTKKKKANDDFIVTLPTAAYANSEVKIRVVDDDTKDPVKKAQVDVFLGTDKYNGKKVAYNATDDNGTFTFVPAEAGKYVLYVDKSGYDEYKTSLTVAAGAPTTTVAPTTTTVPPTTKPAPTTTVPPTTPAPTTTVPPTTKPAPTTTEPPVTTTTPPAPTTTKPPAPSGDSGMLLILVVVIIVIAIAAYFLMKGKGKGAEKPKNGNAKKAKEEKAGE